MDMNPSFTSSRVLLTSSSLTSSSFLQTRRKNSTPLQVPSSRSKQKVVINLKHSKLAKAIRRNSGVKIQLPLPLKKSEHPASKTSNKNPSSVSSLLRKQSYSSLKTSTPLNTEETKYSTPNTTPSCSSNKTNSTPKLESKIERRNALPPRIRRKQVYHKKFLEKTHQELRTLKGLIAATPKEIMLKRVCLPDIPSSLKTVVFDLDETLVRSCENGEPPDVIIKAKLAGGVISEIGIKTRPFLRELLNECAQLYEVLVFTASTKTYADAVLDYLDPFKDLIHHRIYRENCIQTGGLFVKDLRIFENRKLSKIVLVDNLAHSFAFQVHNGIPITSWFGCPADKELKDLLEYLKALATVDDVRVLNQETFRFSLIFENL